MFLVLAFNDYIILYWKILEYFGFQQTYSAHIEPTFRIFFTQIVYSFPLEEI